MEAALDQRLILRIDRKTSRALARAARQAGISKSDFARDALRRRLARSVFDYGCSVLQPYAERRGIFTDDDVFRVLAEK